MQSWDRLLHYEPLTASYRSAPSLLNYFFTDKFYKNPVTIYGDTVSMISIAATNTPGPVNLDRRLTCGVYHMVQIPELEMDGDDDPEQRNRG